LFVIFTTVAMDLVGFGMIVTLSALYGRELGATPFQLGVLGASYSLFQFFFAPIWGSLSDRHGRRPILLMSLAGSTLSYLIFAFATLNRNFTLLLVARAVFAANLSAAQAYIADSTPPSKRAVGMGLIGAAFGIGFILGPAIGGIAASRLGLAWPGFIAAGICGLNFLLACVRLPESLPAAIRKANQKKKPRAYDPLNLGRIRGALKHPFLGILLLMTFVQIFAFSNIEQTFALLFQFKFSLDAGAAAERTGWLLAFVGVFTGLVQGLGLRALVPKLGEKRMLSAGLFLFSAAIAFLPFGGPYWSYFALMLPLALGRSLIDPSMASLISQSAGPEAQGETFGLSQGLGSLARALGPFCGLLAFSQAHWLPYLGASALAGAMFFLSLRLLKQSPKKLK
jgi:MFS family permease